MFTAFFSSVGQLQTIIDSFIEEISGNFSTELRNELAEILFDFRRVSISEPLELINYISALTTAVKAYNAKKQSHDTFYPLKETMLDLTQQYDQIKQIFMNVQREPPACIEELQDRVKSLFDELFKFLHKQCEALAHLESTVANLKTSRTDGESRIASLEKKLELQEKRFELQEKKLELQEKRFKLQEKTKLIGDLLTPLSQVRQLIKSRRSYFTETG